MISRRKTVNVLRENKGLTMNRIKLVRLACECLVIATLGTVATAAAAQDVPADQASAQTSSSDVLDPRERTLGGPLSPAATAPAASGDLDRLRIQFGVMPRFITNYFQSEDDFGASTTAVPKKTAHIVTLSANVEYDLVSEADKVLQVRARVRPNFFTNLKGADSTDIDAALAYTAGPNQLTLGYVGTPKRLSSVVSGTRVYGESEGFNAEYVRKLSKLWRARVSYQYSRETFSAFKERDLSVDQFRADLRYRLSRAFMPSVGFEYRRAYARVDNYDYKRPALMLSVTSELGRAVYMNFRYRYSERTYLTDLATDSNFGREDHRHEFSFYGTYQLGSGLSLFAFADHTTNKSNLISHDFKSEDGGLGLFYQF